MNKRDLKVLSDKIMQGGKLFLYMGERYVRKADFLINNNISTYSGLDIEELLFRVSLCLKWRTKSERIEEGQLAIVSNLDWALVQGYTFEIKCERDCYTMMVKDDNENEVFQVVSLTNAGICDVLKYGEEWTEKKRIEVENARLALLDNENDDE